MARRTLADEHDLALRADFADFLDTFPQGIRKFPFEVWPKATGKAEPHAGGPDDEHWANEVAEIYGVSALDRLYAKAGSDGGCHLWNVCLLPHAYLVARTHGGDPIVQVTRGKHAGKILLTNHETYYGFFEHLRLFLPSEEEREFLDETRREWRSSASWRS